LQTKYATTIEDMIRPGVMLPLGAHPPRRLGLLAGDADCYTVFEELINPIVGEYHGLNGEEWEDPELPREGYFEKRDVSGGREEEGVIKSGGGGDEDSFEDEEDGDSNQSSSTTTQEMQQKTRPNLRRHSTIINNPLLVSSKQVDPENKYIISTRIRIARSLDGVRFPTTMSRAERRRVQSLIKECCANFQSPKLGGGVYLPVLSMSTDQNLDLIERHILFDNPNEWTIASGLARDWPDGRGLYANVSDLQSQTPDFMIWVNEEDHLRLMCLRKGGDIQGVFTTLMMGVRELERELRCRGWEFAIHPKLGYLTCCPTNVGTTMRASVHVRLSKLGRCQGFGELVQALKLEVRGKYGEADRAANTAVFDISNAERLGKSEVHLINVMVEGVATLIELERRLERGEVVDCEGIAREIR
jgi:creatine kinase